MRSGEDDYPDEDDNIIEMELERELNNRNQMESDMDEE